MSCLPLLLLALTVLMISARIPSLAEISKMNDPVLNEVFRESHIDMSGRSLYSDEPPPVPPTATAGEVPITHDSGLGGRVVQTEDVSSSIGRLAANGANVFYRGAQTVGQAFGISNGNYNLPLLDQAASIIG